MGEVALSPSPWGVLEGFNCVWVIYGSKTLRVCLFLVGVLFFSANFRDVVFGAVYLKVEGPLHNAPSVWGLVRHDCRTFWHLRLVDLSRGDAKLSESSYHIKIGSLVAENGSKPCREADFEPEPLRRSSWGLYCLIDVLDWTSAGMLPGRTHMMDPVAYRSTNRCPGSDKEDFCGCGIIHVSIPII